MPENEVKKQTRQEKKEVPKAVESTSHGFFGMGILIILLALVIWMVAYSEARDLEGKQKVMLFLYLCASILLFVIGFYIQKGKNWARILFLVSWPILNLAILMVGIRVGSYIPAILMGVYYIVTTLSLTKPEVSDFFE